MEKYKNMTIINTQYIDETLTHFKGKEFTTSEFIDYLKNSYPIIIDLIKKTKITLSQYISLILSTNIKKNSNLSNHKDIINGKKCTVWFYENIDLFEMANLRQNRTGLPMVIWVSEKGNTKHGPRIKVSKTHSHKTDIYNSVSVSIANPAKIMAGSGLEKKDLQYIQEYIEKNKKTLLKYWDGSIDTYDLIEQFRTYILLA